MIYIFNRNWVDTRWQHYTTHLHADNTQNTQRGEFGKCGPCPVFASYTLAFALQLRKKHGKPSVLSSEELSKQGFSGFGGLVVSMLASGTQVRGFKPGRSRRIFRGEKILSMPSFGREVKSSVPCRSFAACKRNQQLSWKSQLQG